MNRYEVVEIFYISTRLTCKNSSNGTFRFWVFFYSIVCTFHLKRGNTDLQLVVLMSTPYFEMLK